MIVNGSIRITRNMTVGELRQQLRESGVPDYATIDLYVETPDRPGEVGTKEIQVQWDTSAREAVQFCSNHEPVQHRDNQRPWCNRCGRDSAGVIVNDTAEQGER